MYATLENGKALKAENNTVEAIYTLTAPSVVHVLRRLYGRYAVVVNSVHVAGLCSVATARRTKRSD